MALICQPRHRFITFYSAIDENENANELFVNTFPIHWE